MGMKTRQRISIILLMVYAFFFASTNLFYHTHQLEDGTIVHSHIFWGGKAHSHSASQLQIIHLFDTVAYDAQVEVIPQPFIEQACADCCTPYIADTPVEPRFVFSLRAPPTI